MWFLCIISSLVFLSHSITKIYTAWKDAGDHLSPWPQFLFTLLKFRCSSEQPRFPSSLLSVPLYSMSCVLRSPLSPLSPPPQCDKEIVQVQSQLEDYKDPPLSLSRLSLKQQKFKTFRETANVSVAIFVIFCLLKNSFTVKFEHIFNYWTKFFSCTWLTATAWFLIIKASFCFFGTIQWQHQEWHGDT